MSEICGGAREPANDAHHVREAGAAALGEMPKNGGRNANLICDLRPSHLALLALRIERGVNPSRIEAQNMTGRDSRQARTSSVCGGMTRDEAFGRAVEPAKHLQDTIRFGNQSCARASHRGWAKRVRSTVTRGCEAVLRRAIHFARGLRPGNSARLALRIECGIERAKAEVTLPHERLPTNCARARRRCERAHRDRADR